MEAAPPGGYPGGMRDLKTRFLQLLRHCRFLWQGGPACRNGTASRLTEGMAAFLFLSIAFVHVFNGPPGNDAQTYFVVPPLLWAAIRFGPRGALLGTILLYLVATTQTTLGMGPFAHAPIGTEQPLGALQGFLSVAALCSLTLAVLVEDLRRSRAEQAAGQERMDAVFRRMPGLVWTVDNGMRFTWLRGTMTKNGDVPPEKLVGLSLFDFFGTKDPAFPALAAHRKALAGEPAEYRQPWQDHVYQCHVDPLRDPGGRVTGAVGVAQDVTGELEEEAQRERARKMEALARLAGRVAHDFNNSLTAILGYCDLLVGDFPPGDARADDVRSIERAALRAAATADRLTTFSPHRMNEARPVDLNALVQEYDASLGEMLGAKISRVYRLESGLPLVRIDPAQMREMIRQLASNAREAMPEGGQLVIATQRRRGAGANGSPSGEGDHARVSVHDTGSGLSEEARTHLFEPYFSTWSREKDKGLGLATCYGLVRQNGGCITFNSTAGKGTAFHLDFPLWNGAVPDAVTQARTSGESPRGTETLLLAEDEESVRQATARVLEGLGYKVLAAADGVEALRILDGEAGRGVRLLLSDIVMPGMNGVELARKVSTMRPEVRRLLMSGYAERSLMEEGTLPPGTAFIQKPFAYPALARRIREILDTSTASSDLLK